jgi:predicted unusual protein kinase regulating ubiquinone biosynthesis (AarF/ABC1/UbiB family)
MDWWRKIVTFLVLIKIYMDTLLELSAIYFSNVCVKMGFLDEETYYDRLLKKIEKNGVVFIKIAQILSSRQRANGGLPIYFIEKLQNMQDKCFFYSNTVREGFKYISEKPLAAGSICNVHLINYKDEICIIKTVHNDISQKIDECIEKLLNIRKTCHFFKLDNRIVLGLDLIDLDDYTIFLKKQILLVEEANQQEIIANIFVDVPIISIPKVYEKNNDYIIMEFIPGMKYFEFIQKYPERLDEASTLIYCAFYKMITQGIVHGDFHHGNFLLRLINDKVHLTILDFGMMCEFTDEQKAILLMTFNFSVDDKTRSAYLIKFLSSINDDFKTVLGKYENASAPDIITKILQVEELVIPMDYITLFVTLQNVFFLITDLKKRKGSEFKTYIIDYAMECGLFDDF